MEKSTQSLHQVWRIASGPIGLIVVTISLLGTYGWHMTSQFADAEKPNCDLMVAAAEPLPNVIVYGTSWCSQCKKTRWYMQDRDIAYCEYDIEQSIVGANRYQALNGKVIPVIEIGSQRLNGYDESAIKLALREEGLL